MFGALLYAHPTASRCPEHRQLPQAELRADSCACLPFITPGRHKLQPRSPSLPQLTSGLCGLELSHPWRGEGILKRAGEAPNSKEQNPGELLSLRSFRCADCPPESTASMGRERTRAVPADVLFEVFCGVFPNVFILHFCLRFWG